MADDQDSGERTEQPTARRLRDARKRGDVHKSREIATTAGLLAMLVVGSLMIGFAGSRLAALLELAIASIGKPFGAASQELGWAAALALVTLVLAFALPIAMVALLSDFLQVGPVFSFEKIRPKLDRLDPVAGLKRMFSTDNAVELFKSLAKTVLLATIAWLVLRQMLGKATPLIHGSAQALGEAIRVSLMQLVGWTVAIFAVIAVADALYQRRSFLNKMRMSLSEIKRENKEDSGDPYLKQRRRELHQEWAQRNAMAATEQAHLLVVNPTHVAIALAYDPDKTPVPMVSAKGEDALALEMRERARDAGVPILRDIGLARSLLARAREGDVVPDDLFDAVAQAIVWARGVRVRAAAAQADHSGETTGPSGSGPGDPQESRPAPSAPRPLPPSPG
ncbi:MAG: EscU/YscU/HrcU family type III secretion system export apparatus switch protein [Burkholderiales bacterium]|nr:EscU/YscU/HrcU family type III secretion system export apparatus switch protein [Burkholderiales bacterium]